MNGWLSAGGLASGTSSVLHLLCLPGGGRWYRALGAGERMTRAVNRGEWSPHLLTAIIAALLAVWSAYGLSGAGVIATLPLLRPALLAITGVYLIRAAALPIMLRHMPDRNPRFLVVSSLIVLAMGLTHAIGLAKMGRAA